MQQVMEVQGTYFQLATQSSLGTCDTSRRSLHTFMLHEVIVVHSTFLWVISSTRIRLWSFLVYALLRFSFLIFLDFAHIVIIHFYYAMCVCKRLFVSTYKSNKRKYILKTFSLLLMGKICRYLFNCCSIYICDIHFRNIHSYAYIYFSFIFNQQQTVTHKFK